MRKLLIMFLTMALYAGKTEINLILGHTGKIDLDMLPNTLYVEDPEIVDYKFNKPKWLLLDAKSVGHTKLYLIDKSKIQHEYKINVRYPIKMLKKIITTLYPNNKIIFQEIPKHLLVKGYARNKGLHDKIMQQIKANIPEKQLIDQITYPDFDGDAPARQINLRVRIVEVRRTVSKVLGIHWDMIGKRDDNSNKFSFIGPKALIADTSVPHTFSGNILMNSLSIAGVLDLLEDDNFATTVQEPNLMVKTGQSASFNVGGRVPINRAANNVLSGGTVNYQEYGINLDYSAKFDEKDPNLIELKVTPSVSDVIASKDPSVNPTFLDKRANTIVELRSGQSIAIAGLVSSTTNSNKSSVPKISNIPFLGQAFRSEDYSRVETEVVFVITPYIVHATQAGMIEDKMNDIGMPKNASKNPGFILGELDA